MEWFVVWKAVTVLYLVVVTTCECSSDPEPTIISHIKETHDNIYIYPHWTQFNSLRNYYQCILPDDGSMSRNM
jgi:hypothetical protein